MDKHTSEITGREFRSGIGYDAHPLVAGRPLWLGGVLIPFNGGGLSGHSDGDVLLHAVCDALLGAAGLGDIGTHFPDTSPEFKGVSSSLLLSRVCAMAGDKGFTVVNIDAVIIASEPNLAPFKERMSRVIADLAKIDPSRVNIKAKTNNGLETGGGIRCFATAALQGG